MGEEAGIENWPKNATSFRDNPWNPNNVLNILKKPFP